MYHLGMQEPREWDTTKVINGDISKSSTDFFVVLAFKIGQNFFPYAGRDLIIDCEAREIMYLVASVRLFVCLCVQRAKKSHYQSKVFVCVPVISGCMRIIARMRSTGF